MSNEIDMLMELDPLHMSEQDIDDIIAYQRKMTGLAAQGVKVKKDLGPKRSLDSVMGALIKPKEPGPKIVRRV